MCLYGADQNACNYGIVVGVMAFLACISFLICDAFFHQISNVDHRKYCVIMDMGFSGTGNRLWFSLIVIVSLVQDSGHLCGLLDSVI